MAMSKYILLFSCNLLSTVLTSLTANICAGASGMGAQTGKPDPLHCPHMNPLLSAGQQPLTASPAGGSVDLHPDPDAVFPLESLDCTACATCCHVYRFAH